MHSCYHDAPVTCIRRFWWYLLGPFCLWYVVKLYRVHKNLLLACFLCYPNILPYPLILFVTFYVRFPPHSTLLGSDFLSNICVSYTFILSGFYFAAIHQICFCMNFFRINWPRYQFVASSSPTILYLDDSFNINYVNMIQVTRPGWNVLGTTNWIVHHCTPNKILFFLLNHLRCHRPI